MITYGFIADAKCYLGSLGFTPKNTSEMQLTTLNHIVADFLLRLKQELDCVSIYCRYSWIVNHWEKTKKAMLHEKWQSFGAPYPKVDVQTNNFYNHNFSVVTNIFSSNFVYVSFDGKIKIQEIQKVKTKQNPFENVEIDSKNYIFTKDYLKTVKRKKYIDKSKAVAEFTMYCVDHKRDKYISTILFNEDALIAVFGSNVVQSEIKDLIKTKTASQAMLIMTTIMMLNVLRMQRMNSMLMMRRF